MTKKTTMALCQPARCLNYDHRNRLVSIFSTASSGYLAKVAAYEYDVFDLRISPVDEDANLLFIYKEILLLDRK